MEHKVSNNPDNGKFTTAKVSTEYRETVRKQLNDEVKNIVDLEIQKAAQELIEEQKKATKQLVEEFRATIREIVQEEKEEIWKRTETLKESTLQTGL